MCRAANADCGIKAFREEEHENGGIKVLEPEAR